MNERDVAVVVVTYNAEPWLRRCLDSCRQSGHPVRVVVVDNGSRDRSVEIARSDPEITLLQQPGNLGFGAANNLGIARARALGANWIFLLNQDAFLAPQTIERLLAAARRAPRFGVLSPLHLAENGTDLDPVFIHHIATGNRALVSDLRTGELDEIYELPFVNAAGWLLSPRCLQTVGGFDPAFFLYGEDDDYCNRVSLQGLAVGVVPAATMIHARGGQSGADEGAARAIGAQANRQYLRMALDLKRLDRPFMLSFLGLSFDFVARTLRLLLGLKPRAAAVLVRAYAKLLRQLPRLRRHRRLARVPGDHWIATS